MRRSSLLCAAVFALRTICVAGTLNVQWSVDLSVHVGTIPSTRIPAGTIFGVRFSPDGSHIAVLAGESSSDRSRARNLYLFVVPTDKTNGPVQNFLLNSSANDTSAQNRWSHFDWALRGDSVLVGGELIRVEDKKGCPATWQRAGKDDRLLVVENCYADENQIVQVMLQDASCNAETSWLTYPSDWIAKDKSLDRGLVLIARPLPFDSADLVKAEAARVTGMDSEILIFNPINGRVIQQWQRSEIQSSWALRFGDNGKIICGGGMAKAPVRCWDVDSGKRMAEATSVSGGMPIAVSSRGHYAVASDFRAVSATPFSRAMEVLRRRVIWDVKTAKDVVSWHPELQTYDVGIRPVKRKWSVFAISPTGDYFAEGGDGSLRLYTIKPD